MAGLEVFCQCDSFWLWYFTDEGIPVCHCGHPVQEHLDLKGSCIGVSEVSRGTD